MAFGCEETTLQSIGRKIPHLRSTQKPDTQHHASPPCTVSSHNRAEVDMDFKITHVLVWQKIKFAGTKSRVSILPFAKGKIMHSPYWTFAPFGFFYARSFSWLFSRFCEHFFVLSGIGICSRLFAVSFAVETVQARIPFCPFGALDFLYSLGSQFPTFELFGHVRFPVVCGNYER